METGLDFDRIECQAAVLGLHCVGDGKPWMLFELVKTSL